MTEINEHDGRNPSAPQHTESDAATPTTTSQAPDPRAEGAPGWGVPLPRPTVSRSGGRAHLPRGASAPRNLRRARLGRNHLSRTSPARRRRARMGGATAETNGLAQWGESRISPAAHRRRAKNEAMTLIEIMIVIIIMALIATAVSFAILPQFKKAKIKQTRTDAGTVRSAASLYLGESTSGGCPTVTDLVSGQYLDKGVRKKDAWNNDFQINCDGDNVTVVSAGPDGQMGNEDDIRVGD